jgi:Domain of unknown function (DUF5615)
MSTARRRSLTACVGAGSMWSPLSKQTFEAPGMRHLAYCFAEGRVLFTQDEDFLRLHAAGFPHAGIAYCHQEARSVGEIIRGLQLIWEVYDPEEMTGRIEYL